MDDWIFDAEAICMRCGGTCCHEAHPPVSSSCYDRLTNAGIPPERFEHAGYTRLRTKENGECIMWEGGKCSIHTIKPETCRAGPFTFDVTGGSISIYLKHESICPLVALLKSVPGAYRQQYELAEQSIVHLVKHLTGDEVAAICRIEEPDTELVAVLPIPGGPAL